MTANISISHFLGHLSHVLFPDVMREFLASQSFIYRGKQTPFPDDAIGEAIRELGVVKWNIKCRMHK